MNDFPHYFKALPPGCTHVDVYRVLDLFGVTDAPLQHAIKKLLCAGARGPKDQGQDIAEAIATLQRWQQMREEEQPEPDLREAVADIREILENDGPAFDISNSPDVWTSQPAPAPDGAERRFGPITSDPADAERNIREKEDAERAAYLARWKDAPEWADQLQQLPSEHCMWTGGGFCIAAGHNLLGSVRCEPRPQPVEDPERAAYLARWANAPEWAQWLSQDHDGECGWSTEQPSRYEGRWLCTVPDKESFGESLAPPNLLGSFGCEPRPTPAGGQGVGP